MTSATVLTPREILSFNLFQVLNCTVNPAVLKSPHKQNNGSDSPSKHKEREKERENERISEVDVVDWLNLDRDKMMSHVLDCLSALKVIDEFYDKEKKNEVYDVKKKVFLKAIQFIMEDRSPAVKIKPDLERLLQSFPDNTKLSDDRKFLSLHWSVLEDAKMEQKEID